MMKSGLLALACLLLVGGVFHNPLSAQPRHVIKTNMMSFLTRNFGGAYEFAATPSLSLALEGNYVTDKRGEGTGLTTSEKGFNFIPQLRYYPSTGGGHTVAPKGLFFGAMGFYEKRNAEIASDSLFAKGVVTGLGAGLALGYQWIVSDRFVCELSYTPVYAKSSVDGAIATASFNGSPTPVYEPPKKLRANRFGIYIGVAF